MTEATAIVASLDGVLATFDSDRPYFVVDVLRARVALGMPAPRTLSPYARTIEEIEHGDFSASRLALDRANFLLENAGAFVEAAYAPALADVLEQRALTPAPRLVALLARLDPERCVRLVATLDNESAAIECVTEAYLALADDGATIPPAIERAWERVVDARTPSNDEYWTARLRAAARRDAQEALLLLDEVVADQGAAEVSVGVIAVLAHTRAWHVLEREYSVESRAFMLAGLARGEPDAPALGDALERLVREWEAGGLNVDRTTSGAFGMVLPLLAAAAAANRDDLIARVRDVFQPSTDQLRWATFAETRRRFLASGAWDPATWERWVPADYVPTGRASGMHLPLPSFTAAQIAAWWKISTLPFATLPWHEPYGAGLP